MLITLEGIDKSGKTTTKKLLKQTYNGERNLVFTSEPQEQFKTGEIIRSELKNEQSSDLQLLFLFLANRVEHIENFIKPHMKQGDIVICDRYMDSLLAYQSASISSVLTENQIFEYIQQIQSIPEIITPDKTFYIDISANESIHRSGSEMQEKYEKQEFLQNVRHNYRKIARFESQRIEVLDGEALSKEEIVSEIIKFLDKK